MGMIYAAAKATLVACTGENADHGFPGVSNQRLSSGIQNIGPFTLSCVGIADLVPESIWETRGWTLQEGFLYRRRLFFTGLQVVYICNTTVYSEFFGENDRLSLRSLEACLGFDISESSYAVKTVTELLLTQYSTRHLSFQSDALSAITGVLNSVGELVFAFRHIF
jgi:hypothetical protein